MKSLVLKRIVENGAGTFGVLIIDGLPRLVTLELPWHDNERDISCIPVGNYMMKRFRSDVHGETWEVADVPDRGIILLHVANTIFDLKGCIGIATLFGTQENTYGIQGSRSGMGTLRSLLGDADNVPIVIMNR